MILATLIQVHQHVIQMGMEYLLIKTLTTMTPAILMQVPQHVMALME